MRHVIFKRGGYGQGVIGATGGDISGKVFLFRDPVGDLEASTKNYVDLKINNLSVNQFLTGIMVAGRVPEFTGDMIKLSGNPNTTVKTGSIAAGSYPKVTVNLKGQITSGFLLSDSDLPSFNWNKIVAGKPITLTGYGITDSLNTSGGIFTGTLKVSEVGEDQNCLVNKEYVDSISGESAGVLPCGIVYRPTNDTLSGFLRCNGGLVSKATYPALYAIIGDRYTSGLIKGMGKPWAHQYQMNSSGSNFGTSKVTLPNLPLAGSPKLISTNTKLYALYPNALYVSNKDATGLPTTWLRLYFTGGTPSTVKDVVIKNNFMYVLTDDRIRGFNLTNPETVDSWSFLSFITSGIDTDFTNIFTTKDKLFITDGYKFNIYSVSTDGSLTLFKNVTVTPPNWNKNLELNDGFSGRLGNTHKVSFIVKDSNRVTVVIIPQVMQNALDSGGTQSVTFTGSLIVTYTAELDGRFNFNNVSTPVVKYSTGSFSSYSRNSTYTSQTFYTFRDFARDMVVTDDAIYYFGGGRVTQHFWTAGSPTNYGDYYEQDRYILRSTINALGEVSPPALLSSNGGFYGGSACISNRRLLLAGGIETGTQYPVSPQTGGIPSLNAIATGENTAVPILDYDSFITLEGVPYVGSDSFYLPFVTPELPETYAFIRY